MHPGSWDAVDSSGEEDAPSSGEKDAPSSTLPSVHDVTGGNQERASRLVVAATTQVSVSTFDAFLQARGLERQALSRPEMKLANLATPGVSPDVVSLVGESAAAGAGSSSSSCHDVIGRLLRFDCG